MANPRSYKSTSSAPPPWEVLVLVAPRLDPKTLAIATCVSSSWSVCMSSDHIWHSFCTAHYPSISQLRLANPSIPYRRLYAMAYIATRRRVITPSKPQLSLDRLIFLINISTREKNHPIINVAKPGSDLDRHKHKGVFRFDIDASYNNAHDESIEDVKISWNVLVEGWREVFTMIEMEGKVGFRGEGWFSAELPCSGCCWSDTRNSGMVADLKLKLSDDEANVEKVIVGIMSIVNWRYVSLESGLRYLQHFLVL